MGISCLVPDASQGGGRRQRSRCYRNAKRPRGSRCRSTCASVVVGFVIGAAWPRRPRPAAATAAGDRSFKELSSNGRPVALLSRHPDPAQVRYCPSTRIPSPSHAAAAACLPTSGPPAFGTLRAARSRTTLRTTTWRAATPECSPAGAVARARGSLAVDGMPPSARYRERGVPCLCDASTAYAALSQRGTV